MLTRLCRDVNGNLRLKIDVKLRNLITKWTSRKTLINAK